MGGGRAAAARAWARGRGRGRRWGRWGDGWGSGLVSLFKVSPSHADVLNFFSKLLLIVVLSKVATTCIPASSFLHYAFSSRTRTLRVLRPPASTTCFWVLATDSAHGHHATIISASSRHQPTAPAQQHQQRGTTSPQQQHSMASASTISRRRSSCAVLLPVRERKKCVATVANIEKFTYVHLNCNKQ